jgi:hypothetical protein
MATLYVPNCLTTWALAVDARISASMSATPSATPNLNLKRMGAPCG